MKKTLITLLAMAGAAVAATPQSITLGSYVTYNSTNYDMIDSFAGLTADQVNTNYGIGTDDQNKLTYDTDQTITLNTTNMLQKTAGEIVPASTQVQITKITFLGRADSDDYQAQGSKASISIGGTTYVSSTAEYTDKTSGYNLVSYSFTGTNCPTITLGSSVTFTLDYSGTGDANKMPVSVFKGTNITGAPDLLNGWLAPFQLTASVVQQVPEPTTATLSLLALAGLATRRRRAAH